MLIVYSQFSSVLLSVVLGFIALGFFWGVSDHNSALSVPRALIIGMIYLRHNGRFLFKIKQNESEEGETKTQ